MPLGHFAYDIWMRCFFDNQSTFEVMLMKYLALPFSLDVPGKAYHYKAFALGVIKGNLSEEEFSLWLTNKFVNSISGENIDVDSLEEDMWSIKDGLTTVEEFSAVPSTLFLNGFDITVFLKSAMCNGYYITGTFDEYYIPNKPSYRKNNFIHDYVLYGYNENTGVFKSAGYTISNRYEAFEIQYADFINSLQYAQSDYIKVTLHQFIPSKKVELDINAIKSKLSDYICSSNRSELSTSERQYGIKAWEKVAELFISGEIDIRYTRSFLEHRDMMYSRLRTLSRIGHLSDDTLVYEYFTHVLRKARIMYSLAIKYKIKGDKGILERLSLIYAEIICAEHKLILRIMEAIR